jgi:hypothetical protein
MPANSSILIQRLPRLIALYSLRRAFTPAEIEVLGGPSRAQIYRYAARGRLRIFEGRIPIEDVETLLRSEAAHQGREHSARLAAARDSV